MLWIGTPTYDGNLHWYCASGLMETAHYCATKKIGFSHDVIPHDAFIGRARNKLVSRFMASKFRDLLFVDADIGFDVQGVIDLCTAEPPIVMGLYLMKAEEARYPALMTDPLERHPSDTRLIKLKYGPTGFMRIRREVFEAMEKKWPNDYYIDGPYGKVFDYFPHGRFGNDFIGEDIQFCNRAQELGFDIWAMQGIKLKHVGEKVWERTWQIDRPVLLETPKEKVA